ncbi:hypothetical protein PSPO01_07044 [Paraphaeosphaeria sporulosa]
MQCTNQDTAGSSRALKSESTTAPGPSRKEAPTLTTSRCKERHKPSPPKKSTTQPVMPVRPVPPPPPPRAHLSSHPAALQPNNSTAALVCVRTESNAATCVVGPLRRDTPSRAAHSSARHLKRNVRNSQSATPGPEAKGGSSRLWRDGIWGRGLLCEGTQGERCTGAVALRRVFYSAYASVLDRQASRHAEITVWTSQLAFFGMLSWGRGCLGVAACPRPASRQWHDARWDLYDDTIEGLALHEEALRAGARLTQDQPLTARAVPVDVPQTCWYTKLLQLERTMRYAHLRVQNGEQPCATLREGASLPSSHSNVPPRLPFPGQRFDSGALG